MGPQIVGSFPYYSHTTPIRIPKGMRIGWETYHKGVPLLKVPEKYSWICKCSAFCSNKVRVHSLTNGTNASASTMSSCFGQVNMSCPKNSPIRRWKHENTFAFKTSWFGVMFFICRKKTHNGRVSNELAEIPKAKGIWKRHQSCWGIQPADFSVHENPNIWES